MQYHVGVDLNKERVFITQWICMYLSVGASIVPVTWHFSNAKMNTNKILHLTSRHWRSDFRFGRVRVNMIQEFVFLLQRISFFLRPIRVDDFELMAVRAHSHKVKPFIMCYLVVDAREHAVAPISPCSRAKLIRRPKGARHASACTTMDFFYVERIKPLLCTSKLYFNLRFVHSIISGGIFSSLTQQHHWCHMFFPLSSPGYGAYPSLCLLANEIIKQFQTGKHI